MKFGQVERREETDDWGVAVGNIKLLFLKFGLNNLA